MAGTEAIKRVLGFSGGVDSQATARWLLNHYDPADVILLNSDAGGNEHPITTEFVERYSGTVHPVVLLKPTVGDLGTRCKAKRVDLGLPDDAPMDFAKMAELKGVFPSRMKQFCTEHLKLRPQERWIKDNLRGLGLEYERYSGVRREEGARNKSWRVTAAFDGWDDVFACPLHHPIADWSKQMCFDYCHHHGEETNPLYAMGFDRVGCAPCVNANKGDIQNWAMRFPEMIDKVREWEKQVGKTFFMPMGPDGKINWIDDVVAWALTTRGGKQSQLPVVLERSNCESNYGLCE